MRLKSDPQRYFHWSTPSTSKIVWRYEEKYNRISETLDDSPELLDLAAADLRKLSTGGRRGREATYTAENLFRAIIVHQIEEDLLQFRWVNPAPRGSPKCRFQRHLAVVGGVPARQGRGPEREQLEPRQSRVVSTQKEREAQRSTVFSASEVESQPTETAGEPSKTPRCARRWFTCRTACSCRTFCGSVLARSPTTACSTGPSTRSSRRRGRRSTRP